MIDKAQEILETEFGGRHPDSVLLRGSIFWLGAAWSAFQLWATWAGTLNTQKLGAIHLAFGMALVFLAFPTKHGPRNRVPWYDRALAAAGVAASLYIVVDSYNLVAIQGGLPVNPDVWFGTFLLIVPAVAAHRRPGFAPPLIARTVLFYALRGPASTRRL